MLALDNLSDMALLEILGYVTGRTEKSPCLSGDTWKAQLPLLGVCIHWRSVLLESVYKCAYVHINERDAAANTSRSVTESMTEHEKPPTSTNLSLLQSTGNLDQVKALSIYLRAKDNLSSLLDCALKLLVDAKETWPAIEHLDLTLEFYGQLDFSITSNGIRRTGPKSTRTPNNQLKLRLEPYVKRMVDMVPNVTEFSCYDGSEHDIYGDLLSGLTTYYVGKQLKSLRCSSTHAYTPGLCSLAALTCVDLDCKPHAYTTIPLKAAGTLKRLRLRNIPCTILESMVCSLFDEGETVTFPKLESLSLEYAAPDNGSFSNPAFIRDALKNAKIEFPMLRALRVYNSAYFFPVLAISRLPASMDRVEVSGSPAVIELVEAAGMKQTKALLLNPRIHPTVNAKSAMDTVYRMFDKQRVGVCGTLGLYDKHVTLDSGSTGLEDLNITHLTVAAPTSTVEMLALLTKMTKLSVVSFASLSITGDGADVSIPDSCSTEAIAPLVSPINILMLNYADKAILDEVDTVLVKYLLLCLPALKYVIAPQIPAKPITDHVALFRGIYPHLPDICFSLAAPPTNRTASKSLVEAECQNE